MESSRRIRGLWIRKGETEQTMEKREGGHLDEIAEKKLEIKKIMDGELVQI